MAGQEATVRTGHGTTHWFQKGKGQRQVCILSSCLFNLYAEHIMRKAGPDEAEAGIKIAGRNINNLRYADDTTLMAESEEELKSLFHFHQEAFYFLFTFCHKGGVICMSEVIDISPSNLGSSLCFFKSSVSHDVLCI